MNLRMFDTAEDVIHGAARTILQRVEKQETTVIALSGGATPQPMYELLGASPRRDRLAAHSITWVVVDERYVPPNHPRSNSGMIQSALFPGGMASSHRFLHFRTELHDPDRTADRFDEEWHALGLAQLDVVILGVGDDGHTASLFPGTGVLEVEDRVAAAVYVPRLDEWRVTLTLPVVRSARLRIVLAAGKSKASIVSQVAAGADYPVARAMSGEGEAWWFIDRAAGSELS